MTDPFLVAKGSGSILTMGTVYLGPESLSVTALPLHDCGLIFRTRGISTQITDLGTV
jgi:hypothetical protein